MADKRVDEARYWRANLRILTLLLLIWFFTAFGLGILGVELLNRIQIAGFPLGFWFAQQGAIYIFILLIFLYARWMDRVDDRFRAD